MKMIKLLNKKEIEFTKKLIQKHFSAKKLRRIILTRLEYQ